MDNEARRVAIVRFRLSLDDVFVLALQGLVVGFVLSIPLGFVLIVGVACLGMM